MIDLAPDQFDDLVLKALSPVLLYVSATWCGPCKALRPIMAEFEKEVAGVIIVKVDADLCRGLLNQLEVRAVPALIAFRDGVEVARHMGIANKQQLNQLLGL